MTRKEEIHDQISKTLSELADNNDIELSWQIQGYVDYLFGSDFKAPSFYGSCYALGWHHARQSAEEKR